MGRRAKNKQGDPLPLDADPDLRGSSIASKLSLKPGLEAKPSASNLNAKLGKRKPERGDDGDRATKKPKGARPTGKSEPRAKVTPAKAKGKPVKPNSIHGFSADRSLFHNSDTTDEDNEGDDGEEFTGFTGDLGDLESDEDETEEYV